MLEYIAKYIYVVKAKPFGKTTLDTKTNKLLNEWV